MSKALTDPIAVAEAMADANAEVLDELPAIEQGRYRRMARAAIAALPPAVPDRLAEAIARDESSLRGFLDWDRKTDLSGTQYENLKAAFKAGARHAFNTTPDPVAEAKGPDWEGFGRALMESWPTSDIDGCELFDLCQMFGLVIEVPGGYDPDNHIDAEGICPERGDPWFEYNFPALTKDGEAG